MYLILPTGKGSWVMSHLRFMLETSRPPSCLWLECHSLLLQLLSWGPPVTKAAYIVGCISLVFVSSGGRNLLSGCCYVVPASCFAREGPAQQSFFFFFLTQKDEPLSLSAALTSLPAPLGLVSRNLKPTGLSAHTHAETFS